MIRSILTLLFVIIFLIFSIFLCLIEWIISKFNQQAAYLLCFKVIQWAFRVVEFLAGSKVIVSGIEKVPTDQRVCYVANHSSYFDIVFTYSRCPSVTGFVSKEEIKKVPLLGFLMKQMCCIFINRDDPREGMKAILSAIEMIKSDTASIFIFPEGTRSKTGEMAPFKEGSFKIASKSGCPVIPVSITNSREVFEAHFPILKKTTVKITYGDPIYLNQLEGEDKKHPGAYVQHIIAETLQKDSFH